MTNRAHAMLIGLCVMATACHAQVTRPSAVRATLDSLNAEMSAAFRAGDAARVAGFFSPDATLALIGVADVSGRDGIAGILAPLFVQNNVAEHRFTIAELEAYDSTVYERGTYTWAAAPKGQSPTKVDRGRYSMVRRRSPSGQWLIYRYMENELPASAPAAAKPPR